MKIGILVISALMLSAPSRPATGSFEQLALDIEKQVQLPKGAKPLEAYARYYVRPVDGEVVATYVLPGLDEPAPGEGCEELREDMSSVPCTFSAPKSAQVGAGNRVWLRDVSEMPMPLRDAGACGVVTLVYQIAERRFLEVTCFGQSPSY
jgi:hypothetical protein